ncbi:hypothetical protein JOF41_002373 [Saccharothrix coeruleofusca]|uniref:FixH family protein n=1 Tax=Saccharothrix coeruleofusca TaxID=33919 RepID=UPI001AEB41F5|nr:FixH family protein [Saccharothrix coeruleofusca]MBP2336195.1 hypothetical protein [Saccharothrix coeruleofusca]
MRAPFVTNRKHDRRFVLGLVGLLCLVAACALAVVLAGAAGGGPATLRAGGARHAVNLTVAAARAGTTAVDLTVTGADGRPSTPDEIELEVLMPQMGHVLSTVRPSATSPGAYRAEAVSLPMGGQYEFTVRLSGPDGDDRVVFPLLVSG